VPVMELWDVAENPIDLCVGIDHRQVGVEMGRHLLHLGYRAPCYIGIPEGRDLRAEKRMSGLAAAFAEQGLHLNQVRSDGAPSFEAGRDGAEIALSRTPRPDMLYFLNDHLAFGGLMACEAAGLSVPTDIGVCGFNGLNINNVLPRRLTTSVTPRALMGKAAARMLVAAVRGVRAETCLTMPVRIESGATTRPRLTRDAPAS